MGASSRGGDGGDGFAGTPEEARAIWASAASRWANVARRPTSGDVAVYRRLAGERLRGRVLILGVTPELRDLVAEADPRPVIVDMSKAMHEATSRMLRRADPARENWIEADWTEVDLPRGAFDLVLGDMLWWALPVAQQPGLCNQIHAALDPGGLFVGRVRCGDPARAEADPVSAVQRYLHRLDRPGADPERVRAELLNWLYDHTADHAHRRLDRVRTRSLLLALADAPGFARWADFLRTAADRLIGADWTSQTRDELLDLLTARFELVAEEHAPGYESSQHPILALRPRTRGLDPGS